MEGTNTGHLRLGLDASLDHAYGSLNYLHKISDTRFGDFGAFADVKAGWRKIDGGFTPDLSATAGVELRW